MRRFSFKKGLIFVEGQRRWELVRRLVTGLLQLQDEAGELVNLTDAELLRRWQAGLWLVDEASLGYSADIIHTATPRDLSCFPEKWQAKARMRLGYIEAVMPRITKYEATRWAALIASHAELTGDPKPPCPATVHAWWKRYRNTQSLADLIPHTRGNQPRHVDPRFAFFEEAVGEVYLSQQQLPKSDVIDKVHEKIKRYNQGKAPDEMVKPPGQSTIYRWLEDLQQDLIDHARLGHEVAKVKYRMVLGSFQVANVLERIEIDHTPLDVLLIHKLTGVILGRPWLTLALDKHSRTVWGFYLSFNPPSAHSVLQCLKNGILPKDQWLSRFPQIKHPWPAYGIPDLIAVDNGMDLHSAGLEKTCQELGIQILFTPAATPQYKGSVERFFRTMAKDLIHKLPGTTFSNVEERGDYPSEDLAAIDFETLTELVVTWIVDIYNVSYHRGIKTSPLLKWQESFSRRPVDLPIYPAQLDVVTGIPAERTLFHYGVELEGLHYNSRRLQEIRRRTGENVRVQLKYYEDVIDHIQVLDPFAKEYVQVPCVQIQYAEGLPRAVHRLIRQHARKQFGENFSSDQLNEAKTRIQQIIQQAKTDKKMAARKAASQLEFVDSTLVVQPQNLIDKAGDRLKQVLDATPPDLPDGLNDSLPFFKPLDEGETDEAE